MPKLSGQFHFGKHDLIGANAAEDDGSFLADCFIDTGDLDVLLDFKSPQRLVVGRTGCGKTALLQEAIKRHGDMAWSVAEGHETCAHFRTSMAHVFYRVGACGLKTEAFVETKWAGETANSISASDVSDEAIVSVHPALWRVLGIIPVDAHR